MRESRACRWWCGESALRALSVLGERLSRQSRDPVLLTTDNRQRAQAHETVNVNIVEVPVSVVDSSGNPIRGLTAANFEVYDGGKKQAITSFDKIDFGSKEAAVNAISPLNPAARRSFLLLFDLGFS